MSSATFENILALPHTGTVSRFQVNKDTLEVRGGGIRFQGRRPLEISKVLSVSRVHSGAWANDLLRIDYAEGDRVSSVFFGVAKRGAAGKQVIDQLHALLEGAAVPEQAEPAVLERHRQATEDQAQTTNAAARRLMILGAVVIVVGLVVTGVSFAVAEPGGGSIIAYGAVLVGFILLVRGLAQRTRAPRS